MRSSLKDLQTLLCSAITAAPGAARSSRAVGLSSMIRGDERLSAVRRLNIYADAYFYRLLDCLKEDFPATAAVTGDEFDRLVRRYLEYPPTEPSIFYAGQHLADFLGDHPVGERWPFLAELARLERTLIEVFHGADAPALSASEVGMIAPVDWPSLKFRAHPALRILNCNWRVNDVLRTVESGTEWREPAHAPVTLLVWRQGSQVYYRELAPPERVALEAVSKDAEFAAVCQAFAARFEGEDPAAAIKEMLTRWVADGLLARNEKSAAEVV
jgi:Putative DNA-binding domain